MPFNITVDVFVSISTLRHALFLYICPCRKETLENNMSSVAGYRAFLKMLLNGDHHVLTSHEA